MKEYDVRNLKFLINGISLGDVASLKDLDIKMDAFWKDVWGSINKLKQSVL